MLVAAIYDIHANFPALQAVLEEIRRLGVDQIIVGGDVLPGPMPRETLTCLLDLDIPTRFIYGNGEVAVLEQMMGRDPVAARNSIDLPYAGRPSSLIQNMNGCYELGLKQSAAKFLV